MTGRSPFEIASAGFSGTPTRLPHLETIQRSFGRDMSHVQAFIGGRAIAASQQLGATAYTAGKRIAFAHSPSVGNIFHFFLDKLILPMKKMNLQIYLPLLILSGLLTLLSIKGWENRKEVLLQFNLFKVLFGMNEETKCYAVKEVLRIAPEGELNLSTIPKFSSKERYEVYRSVIVPGGYIGADIFDEVIDGIHITLLKKKDNGELKIIYSCEKRMG